jgi:hypothetical protein
MTLFIDNDMSPTLAKALLECGIEAFSLRECFATSAPDTEWLPVVGERGWIVCTADRGISQESGHLAIVREHRLIVVRWPSHLPGDSPEKKRAWFVRRVRRLLPILEAVTAPALLRVDRTARAYRWDWLANDWVLV